MVFVWKYLILSRQVSTTRINKINTREIILSGYILSAQVLFHSNRIVGSSFYCGIVYNDYTIHAIYSANAGNYSGCWNVFSVNVIGSEL